MISSLILSIHICDDFHIHHKDCFVHSMTADEEGRYAVLASPSLIIWPWLWIRPLVFLTQQDPTNVLDLLLISYPENGPLKCFFHCALLTIPWSMLKYPLMSHSIGRSFGTTKLSGAVSGPTLRQLISLQNSFTHLTILSAMGNFKAKKKYQEKSNNQPLLSLLQP